MWPPDVTGRGTAAARRAFGGVDQIKEAHRDQRGLPLVDALGQDVRFALRLMRRNPGFAVTAVLVLGLGIGVNNMLFTILNAHTLRGLPIPRSDRVLFLSTVDDRGRDRGLSFADYDGHRGRRAALQRPSRRSAPLRWSSPETAMPPSASMAPSSPRTPST